MPEHAPRLPDEAAIRRQFEAWNEGDFDGWLGDAVHPDYEYEPGILVGRAEGERPVYRGRDELRRLFDEWHSEWKMDFTLEGVEYLEGCLIALGRVRMTGLQSGVTVENEVGMVAHYEDGLLRRLRSFPSHAEARAADSPG